MNRISSYNEFEDVWSMLKAHKKIIRVRDSDSISINVYHDISCIYRKGDPLLLPFFLYACNMSNRWGESSAVNPWFLRRQRHKVLPAHMQAVWVRRGIPAIHRVRLQMPSASYLLVFSSVLLSKYSSTCLRHHRFWQGWKRQRDLAKQHSLLHASVCLSWKLIIT